MTVIVFKTKFELMRASKAGAFVFVLRASVCSVDKSCSNFQQLLPYAEFTINSTPSVSLSGRSPFCVFLEDETSTP